MEEEEELELIEVSETEGLEQSEQEGRPAEFPGDKRSREKGTGRKGEMRGDPTEDAEQLLSDCKDL